MMNIDALVFALKALCIAWILMIIWRKFHFRFFLWISKMKGEQLLLGTVVKTEVKGIEMDRIVFIVDNITINTVSVNLNDTGNIIGCVMVPENLDRLINIGSRVVVQVKSIDGYGYASLVSVLIPNRKWWLPIPA